MAQNLSKPGGSKLWNANQRADTADMNGIGTLAEQSLWDGFAARVFGDAPDGFVGDDCLPGKGVGDLEYYVGTGMGLISLVGGSFECDYTPIYVNSLQSGSCDAHDATNPRIDILSLAPLEVDDEASTEKILSGGVLVAQSKYTRRRRSFVLTYTAGTPAAMPAQPATPADNLLVATINVPAAAGAITVNDARTRIGVSTSAMEPMPVIPQVLGLSAESGNARTASVTIKDLDGNTVARTQRVIIEVLDDNGDIDSTVGTATIGAGTALSTTAKARVVAETGTDGTMTISVRDVLGTLSGNLWLKIQPVSEPELTSGPVQPGVATVTQVAFT